MRISPWTMDHGLNRNVGHPLGCQSNSYGDQINMNKDKIFRLVFGLWIFLWLFFLIREDKPDQYKSLKYLYTHDYADKVRRVMGGELYEFGVFCKKNIPQGSTYELSGFKKFSINEMRMRYFLWPLVSVSEDADFKIVYGSSKKIPGYNEYKLLSGTGGLYAKE